MSSDFIPVSELARLTCVPLKSLYNEHSSGRGALAPILTKIGGRLGCWRADYDLWVASQRRLRSPAPEQRPAA
jgi:hypothetical protein